MKHNIAKIRLLGNMAEADTGNNFFHRIRRLIYV
jgi:hypothetical protein